MGKENGEISGLPGCPLCVGTGKVKHRSWRDYSSTMKNFPWCDINWQKGDLQYSCVPTVVQDFSVLDQFAEFFTIPDGTNTGVFRDDEETATKNAKHIIGQLKNNFLYPLLEERDVSRYTGERHTSSCRS